MTYKLIQYERQQNDKGAVTAILVAVDASDGVHNRSMNYSLTDAEVQGVVANEALNLPPILTDVGAKALRQLKLDYPAVAADPVRADAATMAKFTIDPTLVATKEAVLL